MDVQADGNIGRDNSSGLCVLYYSATLDINKNKVIVWSDARPCEEANAWQEDASKKVVGSNNIARW